MAHERDRDRHATPSPPREPEPDESKACPDRKRPEHPSLVPSEPVDPQSHPK
jgi:hypothetical protein